MWRVSGGGGSLLVGEPLCSGIFAFNSFIFLNSPQYITKSALQHLFCQGGALYNTLIVRQVVGHTGRKVVSSLKKIKNIFFCTEFLQTNTEERGTADCCMSHIGTVNICLYTINSAMHFPAVCLHLSTCLASTVELVY